MWSTFGSHCAPCQTTLTSWSVEQPIHSKAKSEQDIRPAPKLSKYKLLGRTNQTQQPSRLLLITAQNYHLASRQPQHSEGCKTKEDSCHMQSNWLQTRARNRQKQSTVSNPDHRDCAVSVEDKNQHWHFLVYCQIPGSARKIFLVVWRNHKRQSKSNGEKLWLTLVGGKKREREQNMAQHNIALHSNLPMDQEWTVTINRHRGSNPRYGV